jgi:hypothetical protein
MIENIFQIILFFVILAGPTSLCLAFTLGQQKNSSEKITAYNLLSFLTMWTGIQLCLILPMGMTRNFNIGTTFCLELIILAIGLVLLSFVRPFRLSPRISLIQRFVKTPELMLMFYLSTLGIILLLYIAAQPVIDMDSLSYHLPFMARWYQDFEFVKLAEFSRFTADNWISEQIGYYPYSWEALCALFMLPFKEDFLVTLPNLIAWAILGLSTYLLGLEFGASSFYSLASSFLLMVFPINLQQINTLHIDLPLAAFFSGSAFFAVAYQRDRAPKNLFMSLLSISILLGIKTSGLVYAALTVLILILSNLSLNNFIRNIKKSRPLIPVKQISIFALALIPVFFLASFWYFRNFIEIGNPLGNVKVQLLGFEIFEGSLNVSKIKGTTLTHLFNPFSLENWKIILLQIVGRLQFPFIIILGLNFLIIPYFKRISSEFDCKRSLYLFILLIGSGFLYWNTPYSASIGEPPWALTSQVFGQGLRYSIPFLGILSVSSSLISSTIKPNKKYIVGLVWICCIFGLVNTFVYDIIRIQGTFKDNVGGGSVLIDNIIQTLKQNPLATISTGNKILELLFVPLVFILIYCLVTLMPQFFIQSYYKLIDLVILRRPIQGKKNITLILAILLTVILSYGVREYRSFERISIYGEVYKYISEQLKPKTKIGYVLSNRSYPLYGKNLDKRVIYLGSESNKNFLDILHDQDIDFIVIGPLIEGSFSSKKEVLWISQNPQIFQPLFSQDPNFSQVMFKILD